eukprot:1028289-Rhodomonas_salina.1
MEREIGLPSKNKAYRTILDFQGNHATSYGADVAGAPNKMTFQTTQAETVPGQLNLNITIFLLDSKGQIIDGRVEESVIQMTVCAELDSDGSCDTLASLQPATFLGYQGAGLRTIDRIAQVESCPVGRKTVQVQFTLPSDPSIRAIWEAECLPCEAGQSRMETSQGAHVLWTCRSCAAGQYIINPNEDECQDCPVGASCNGKDLTGPPSSVWEADLMLGYHVLVSCPQGFGVVNTTSDGVFEPRLQECVPCGQGTECTTSSCQVCSLCQPGHYKSFAGTAACEECPRDTYREAPGATELAQCITCPAESDTRELTAQVSLASCHCQELYYAFRPSDGALLCHKCPLGAVCEDGVSLGTRGGLAAVWGFFAQDTTPGRKWLKSCPVGYRMENSTGYELQECQTVPDGMFIGSNSDSLYTFQRYCARLRQTTTQLCHTLLLAASCVICDR